MKFRIISLAFLIGSILGIFQVHGQERCISGQLVIEYIVNDNNIRTPLKGVQVNIANSEQKDIIGNTVTNANGQFFFLNYPRAPYTLRFFFGNEELIIDRYEQRQNIELVKSSLLKINYQNEKQDLGILVIKKETVRSMK